MTRFAEYCDRVEQHIREHYGIPVITRDIPDPLTGDLDGCEIHIDYALTPEQRLFLLAHLFGHTVQWNVNPRAFELGRPRQPPVAEETIPDIVEYEREAASYGLQLFREVAIDGLDQWLSDYTACDMAYLMYFYRTGEKREFLSFWREGSALVQPQPIPSFTPMRRTLRQDGIVI
jgi:hypothetical protein